MAVQWNFCPVFADDKNPESLRNVQWELDLYIHLVESNIVLIEIVILTIIIEVVTCIGRFSFKMRARDWKWPVRIHHGYVGIVLLIAYFFLQSGWLAIIGASLVFSDALHHFVILPITVGATEFP
jgi:hypothetical protein